MSKTFKLGIVISASDRASRTLGKVSRRIGMMERSVSSIGQSFAKLGAMSVGGAAAIGAGIYKTVDALQDVRKAQGEIASLGIGDLGIARISKEAQKFSSQYAGTTKADFIRASYDIKSGISSLSDEGVAKMTKLAAVTALATKSSTAEMSKLFAIGYGIYRKQFSSDFEFGEKFSAAISGAVKAFRTDGSDLVQGLSTLGAVATKSGYSLQEQLAVLGVSKSAFSSASEAATSYRAFIMGAGKAQKELGLKFTDSTGHLLSMPAILEKIKQKYGDITKKSVQDKLKKAFGSDEAVKILLALIDKTDDLRRAEDDLESSMRRGSAATEEMARKMNRGREFDLLGQQVNNLTTTIGSLFAPTALRVSNTIGNIVGRMQSWIDANPKAAEGLGKLVLKVTGGLGALGAASFGIAVISWSLSMMIKPLRMVTSLMGAFFRSAAGAGRLVAALGTIGSLVATIGAGFVWINSEIAKMGKQEIDDKRVMGKSAKALEEQRARAKAKLSKMEANRGGIFGYSEHEIKAQRAKIRHIEHQLKRVKDGKDKPKENASSPMASKLMQQIEASQKFYREVVAAPVENVVKPVAKAGIAGASSVAIAAAAPQAGAVVKPPANDALKPRVEANAARGAENTRAIGGEIQTLRAQYQALSATVQTLASRPEQHTYHVTITVNGTTADPEAIKRACLDGMQRANQQKSTRSMRDDS